MNNYDQTVNARIGTICIMKRLEHYSGI